MLARGKEIYQLASINEFPKKLFIFANKRRLYSERLHFFESIRVFNSTLEQVKIESVEFKCKICSKNLHAHFGSIQNLSSHLQIHT